MLTIPSWPVEPRTIVIDPASLLGALLSPVTTLFAPTTTVTATVTAIPTVVSPTITSTVTAVPTAVSPTAALTATAVPTGVLPTATPPLPTPAPPPWEPGGNWLADTSWSMAYHVPLLAVFVALGVAALVLYFYFSRRRYAGHALNARLTEFLAGILGAASVAGLLLVLCALVPIPFLSMPIWPLILVVALLGFAGFAVWYYLRRYPARRAAYEREAVKQRYMPAERPRTRRTAPSKPPRPSPANQRRRKKRKKR